MDDIKIFINKILDAIEYKGDKEKFVSEFDNSIKTLCIIDLVESIPAEKQEDLKKHLDESDKSPESIKKILNNFFTPDEIKNSIENTTKTNITDYIKTIAPTLTEPQLERLENVFKEFEKPAGNQCSQI